jgi:hypothetical protein
MASVTTNYGFDVPTSSDLVKNGATQIALLGQDLDTFLFRPFTKNPILNSSFNVWQRGTSGTANGAGANAGYNADRWANYASGTAITVARQATSDTTNLPFIQYCARVQRNSGQTSLSKVHQAYSMETLDAVRFSGQAVTFSFYARKGANFSATSNALAVEVYSGTGTDQNIFGYSGAAAFINSSATLTATWQRFTYTGTVSASSTEIGILMGFTPTGTAGANDYYEITGVMLEIGNQATPYTAATPCYETELAACQRYLPAITTLSASEIGTGFNVSTTQPFITIPFQAPARVAPTGITATATNFGVRNNGGSVITLTALTFNNASPTAGALLGTVASGLVAGDGTSMQLSGTILFTGCEL